MIPKFRGDLNDPGKTNEERRATTVHAKDKEFQEKIHARINPPPEPPKPVVDLKVMDTIMGKGTSGPVTKAPAMVYPSNSIPIPNPNAPIAAPYMIPWDYNQNNIPIVKKYNINIMGMDGAISTMSQVFEDILPETALQLNRMTTLSERNTLHSYIRSILLKRGDGEEVAFDDKKPELMNLLSHMKMMEINPYHYSTITGSAYKTMPDNFLMLRSCYPIRFDKKSNNVSCSVDNIGANVRIYALSVYDELAYMINEGGIVKKLSDVWREMMFYTYIREEILKRKQVPHFAFLHTYYLTTNSTIDFDKLKTIKNTTNIKNGDFQKANENARDNFFKKTMQDFISTKDGYNFTINLRAFQDVKSKEIVRFNETHKRKAYIMNGEKVNINDTEIHVNERSTKCLVAITEAPDQNIIDWSTRTYIIEDGPVRKQVNSGMHSDLTWKTVIFQMLATFATMYKHGIAIKEFSWPKNFYIKTFSDTGPIGYWKYKLRGIDFYIPNMKALLMVDSCFDNVVGGFNKNLSSFNFKLFGDFYDDNHSITLGSITYAPTATDRNAVFKEMYKGFFDSNEFKGVFKNAGGIAPSTEIMNLIDRIMDYNFLDHKGDSTTAKTDLADLFVQEFGFFLHNKIGDLVDSTDEQMLRGLGESVDECKKGDLVAYIPTSSITTSVLYWGIIIDNMMSSSNVKVLILNSGSYSSVDIPYSNIRRAFGDVKQKYKPDHKINSEDELLETYTIPI